MITGIRSALICDRAEVDETGSVNVFGIRGDSLVAASNPGFFNIWVVIYANLDRMASIGQFRVEAADFETVTIPFQIPAGLRVTAMMLPLLIPLLKKGPLTLSVQNDGRGNAFRVTWHMEFDPDAKRLDAAAGREFIEESKKASAMVTAGLKRQQGRVH